MISKRYRTPSPAPKGRNRRRRRSDSTPYASSSGSGLAVAALEGRGRAAERDRDAAIRRVETAELGRVSALQRAASATDLVKKESKAVKDTEYTILEARRQAKEQKESMRDAMSLVVKLMNSNVEAERRAARAEEQWHRALDHRKAATQRVARWRSSRRGFRSLWELGVPVLGAPKELAASDRTEGMGSRHRTWRPNAAGRRSGSSRQPYRRRRRTTTPIRAVRPR